jgi:hypothetical protein
MPPEAAALLRRNTITGQVGQRMAVRRLAPLSLSRTKVLLSQRSGYFFCPV